MNTTSGEPLPVDHELYPALIQCFVIILIGYIAGQLNLLTNTHATGLSRYIGNFALPAVIFKNLVLVKFENISWHFLGSVFFAKAFVFIVTALLTALIERPTNYGTIGLYPIIISQSNDFALIMPIIDAVYQNSHPEFARYIYLIAPINLAILNPFGFFFIELQKRLNLQKKHPDKSWTRTALAKKILLDIIRNPVIICTILGIIFNRVLKQELPNILNQILTPVAQSFSAIALFYLGLSMVGKLSRLNSRLVISVFLLSMMKLVVLPLILRQAVFFFLSSDEKNANSTVDYSNFGFLYGTAPTAPSVVFFVPEADTALQAVASTSLVVSTILAGPIMLVSAKMINLKDLDVNTTATYEWSLVRTGYDVSIISLLCTVIVLIGFFVRHRFYKISLIHRYTVIFVCAQSLHGIWTIVNYFVEAPSSMTAATIMDMVSIVLALTTRTWATSISIALMVTICYSSKLTRRYCWFYNLFAWMVPISAALMIYFKCSIDRSKEEPILSAEKFGNAQMVISIVVLAVCVIITTTNLARITRRSFQLKQTAHENRWVNLITNENRPLVNVESEEESNDHQSVFIETRAMRKRSQLYRHGILVALLDINAFMCICTLLWALLVNNRDGLYYELQFLDTVLLHGQGIMTFLVFALDADLLLPICRRVVKLLNRLGIRTKLARSSSDLSSSVSERSLSFEETIRPDFLRYSGSIQSMSDSVDLIETTFNGQDFCQWLVSNGYMDNQQKAEDYCRELVNSKHIICVSRRQNEENNNPMTNWYAFSK